MTDEAADLRAKSPDFLQRSQKNVREIRMLQHVIPAYDCLPTSAARAFPAMS
jgi:hypothetical protein